jgi:large subunit ribosomal protein L6
MSRVGKQPITLPGGVTVEAPGAEVTVNGPKGSLSHRLLPGISLQQQDGQIIIERKNDERVNRANHGLTRALLANMIEGVNRGYERKLEIHGVGYRAQAQGSDLKFSLGFSHEVVYKVPEGISASVDQNVITISGIDKQKVGQVAAEIRALRKPEPYKGKGIRYADEQILRKSGKSTKE